MHANIAEIRKPANTTIYGLNQQTISAFKFLSMSNNRNHDTANAADYSNHDPLVRHKDEIDSHNMSTKDYIKTINYN